MTRVSDPPMPGPEARGLAGDAILAERARVGAVFDLVCVNGPVLFVALAAPLAFAAIEGAYALAAGLAPGVAAAAALALRGRIAEREAPRRAEALAAVAVSFVVAVFFAAPGFFALGMTPVDALFEAASSVTTTGLSLADGAEHWPFAAHFLRAWLQWIGGFAFVVAALALVVGQGVIAKRLGVAGGVAEDRAASTRTRARRLLAIYGLLSALAVVAVAAAHPEPAKGALIALSAISTGGFSPFADSMGGAGVAAQITAIAACVVGAVSISLWWIAWREGPLKALGDGELKLFACAMVVAAAAVALIEWRTGGFGVWASVFTTFSAQSTAGFSIADVSAFAPASQIALIAAMAIGGCLGATAGGLKAFRLGFVLAAARLTLVRARLSPSARTYLRVFGRRTDADEGTDVMGLLAIYAASAALLWLALALSGAGALPALFDSVSALSTVGLSVGAITGDLPAATKLLATLAMLLGRLEFLALIVVLTPGTWKKG